MARLKEVASGRFGVQIYLVQVASAMNETTNCQEERGGKFQELVRTVCRKLGAHNELNCGQRTKWQLSLCPRSDRSVCRQKQLRLPIRLQAVELIPSEQH